MYNPDISDEEYPDGMAAFTFRSVFVKVEPISKGTSVWNVEGSTNDKWEGRERPNWFKVCSDNTKIKLNYTSGVCYVRGSAKTDGTSHCSIYTIGGHMALTSASVNPDKTDYIYIIPICTSHNFFAIKRK